ncbi:hypothetical protein COCC4DRAFT_182586 [Bipolaris maydis ATCC 48331]|uniref:Uncharacterized protein n=2 Tax=Cochliobolus heterostrophus TaxID=5016 RepID=M2UC94_COCH5|nr:uncharacterized protein COCC4DRAFT_182586 [Bipolaris maydis ATCC 48331]EMD85618.1 hypothetical protein COCHEDRAFT_1198607 [Bipolaris maydis C5]KAJ5028959.1 hypothetical protein J3E73DRAFT_293692 [Bipolaris maydis]ENH98574.1 hypothetical protein COCC4DRAFT_182586 [Bipolaris maydis ATCC 48331]KAJ5063738.1 hypothetical protein J3E74DRAFT_320647 [Bipolaris maydis]KAJ6200001.1 hypothetical protein J3E72DRAFT_307736 [Bipolaris maydis]
MNDSTLARYAGFFNQPLRNSELYTQLNEILDNSELIAEFSQFYRQRTHENECIGITYQSVPTLEEINCMLKQEEKIRMSLKRIRDIVLSHHQSTLTPATEDCKLI